jgi:hypothetical protein
LTAVEGVGVLGGVEGYGCCVVRDGIEVVGEFEGCVALGVQGVSGREREEGGGRGPFLWLLGLPWHVRMRREGEGGGERGDDERDLGNVGSRLATTFDDAGTTTDVYSSDREHGEARRQ